MKRLIWPALGLTATVAFLLGIVAAGSRSLPFFGHRGPAPSATPAVTPSSAAPAPAHSIAPPDFAAVAARAEGAVVSIRAATRATADRPSAHVRYPGDPSDDPAAAHEESASGFVIDPAGEILTNEHVIKGADRITVTLSDGRVFRASLVGVDAAIDVALLQIAAQDPLPVIPLGRSEDVRVGEWVCAIGSPIGYANSVTVGVVSSVDRKVGQWSVDGTIQTDAAMSLGSSGSPLLNSAGEVIGITSAISKQSANIGFAIPISQVAAVLPQLREWGHVSHGYVSLGLTSVTPELRSALHLDPQHGALVQDVPADRAAARAGIRPYDVIVSIDGAAIASDSDVLRFVSLKHPGSTVAVQLWRDGSDVTVPVELEERPVAASNAAGANARAAAAAQEQGPLGLTVRDLDPAAGKQLPSGMTGARVVDVDAAGPARLARVHPGLIVTEVNRQAIHSAAEFDAAVRALRPGDVAALMVYDPSAREYSILPVLLDPHS